MSKQRKTRGSGNSRQSKESQSRPDKWQVAFYEKEDGSHPAVDFLKQIPKEPRRELLKTIAAVIEVGPLRFPTGKNGWHRMHAPKKKGDADMSGILEARDKHGNLLYRLFCVLDRDAHEHGLSLPSLVILGGATKKVGTAISQAKYREIDEFRNDYRATHRVMKEDQPDWFPS